MTTNRLLKCLCATISPILLLSADPAQAVTLSFNFDKIFSDGAVAPTGTPPWLTLTTTDTGTNQVTLDFKANSSMNAACVFELNLNVDSTLDLSRLAFSPPTTIVGAFVLPGITITSNHFKADGDGFYDIQLAFETSDTGGTQRFTAGDEMACVFNYTPIGAETFNAQSFNAQSSSCGW